MRLLLSEWLRQTTEWNSDVKDEENKTPITDEVTGVLVL